MIENAAQIDENSLWETDNGETITFKEMTRRFEEENDAKTFFLKSLLNATYHWFFIQGETALRQELYLPGLSALLNGIEASIRITLREIDPSYDGTLDLSPYKLLSNPLLRQARDAGIDISCLAFPNEIDFWTDLETKKYVQLVQLRHDVCHGNITMFIQSMPGDMGGFFTPECVRPIAAQLLGMSYDWALKLATFRLKSGLRPTTFPIPAIPQNPLHRWLPA